MSRPKLSRPIADLVQTIVVVSCGLIVFFLSGPAFGQTGKRQPGKTRAERTLLLQQRKYADLRSRFQVDLEQLADWCDDFKMADAARETRELAQPAKNTVLVASQLPSTPRAAISRDLSGQEREWRTKLRRIRMQYASDLYRLSREVLRAGAASYAFDLVREVAVHDSDHKQTRALLGDVSWFDPDRKTEPDYHGEWVSPFAAQMMSPPKRHVWDDRFGWVLKSQLPRYEDGFRPWKRKWISVDREAEIRRDFDNAWEIRTDHFLVKTNHSQQRGVEVAKRLEEFHAFFTRTFASFFETPQELEKRFADATTRRRTVTEPLEVHYYATRDEYNQRLVKRIPLIGITNGLYYETDQTCFFYHDPDVVSDHTLFHEATHQIMDAHTRKQRALAARVKARKDRTRVTPWVIAEHNNFWIIEGFACYIESFRQKNGRATLGDPNYKRFVLAQRRVAALSDPSPNVVRKDGYYIPLPRFSGMGMAEFQNDPNIQKNYTQASGMAHFLMHYNDGAYRDALIEFLSQLYRPNVKNPNSAPSIAKLIGISYEELDEQYRQYMNNWTQAQAATALPGAATQ